MGNTTTSRTDETCTVCDGTIPAGERASYHFNLMRDTRFQHIACVRRSEVRQAVRTAVGAHQHHCHLEGCPWIPSFEYIILGLMLTIHLEGEAQVREWYDEAIAEAGQ